MALWKKALLLDYFITNPIIVPPQFSIADMSRWTMNPVEQRTQAVKMNRLVFNKLLVWCMTSWHLLWTCPSSLVHGICHGHVLLVRTRLCDICHGCALLDRCMTLWHLSWTCSSNMVYSNVTYVIAACV